MIRKITLAAGLFTVTSVAVSVLSATPAFAAFHCTPNTGTPRDCIAPLKPGSTTLFLRDGGRENLNGGGTVEVTCWYRDSTATDGFFDHIVWDSQNGTEIGHVNDQRVDFNTESAPETGLAQC